MFRRALGDSVVYGAAGAISRGVQVLLIPIYTRVFAPDELGVIDLLAVVAALLNVTVALEISQGAARHLAEAQAPETRREYASTALWFSILAYTLFAAIAFALAEPLSRWLLGSADLASLLGVAALAIAANGVYVLLQDLLRWRHKPKAYALASLLYTLVTVGTGLYWILVVKVGIVGVYYGQIAGALIGAAASWAMATDLYGLRFSRLSCSGMLRYSLPLVPSSLAVFFNLNVDKIAIQKLLSLGELGIYGVGFRLASVMSLLVMGVQLALTPIIFQTHAREATRHELAGMFRYFLVAAISVILVLGVFSHELVRFFATPMYYEAANVVALLSTTLLFANLYVFAPGPFIAKRTKSVAVISLSTAVLNLLLNLTLIPLLGIVGAALATCLAALVGFVLVMGLSQRLYPAPHSWGRVLVAAGIAAVVLILAPHAPVLPHDFGAAVVAAKLIITTFAALGVALVLLDRSELARLTRRLTLRRIGSDTNL